MADKMKRKKKKNSRQRYVIWGVAIGIVYIIVASVVAGLIITRAREADNTLAAEAPALSSDAPTFMIYRVENRIHRINMDTLESEQVAVVRGVAPDDEVTLGTLQLSPSLDTMYYAVRQSETEHVLMKQDVETGQVWEIDRFLSGVQIFSSPTGNTLFYVRDYEYTLGAPRVVLNDDITVFYVDWAIYDIAWAKDGSYVVLNLAFDDATYPDSVFQPFDIGDEWVLRNRPDGQDRFYLGALDIRAQNIEISPDDKYIAMQGHSVTNNTLDGLWMIALTPDYAIPTFMSTTSNELGEFSWSPDSQWIAYAGYQSTQFDILVVNIETHEIINLTETLDMDERNPNWLPNGDIVFEREGQLWRISLEREAEVLPMTDGAVYMGYRVGD